MNRNAEGIPPQDERAEQSVLGSMMLARGAERDDVIPAVAGLLSPGDYYSPRHQCIYRAICELHGEGVGIDVVTVGNRLDEAGRLEECGGHGYLMDLLQSVPHAANAEHYARIVREKATRRQIIEATDDLKRLAPDADLDVIRQARDAIPDVAEGPRRKRLLTRRLSDVTPRPVEWLWPGRVPLGKLTLFAGDPGLGKSFLMVDIAARVSSGLPWIDASNAANPPGDVILFSAEDDPEDTIRPRLDAAGGDPRRVHVVDGVATGAKRGARPRSFCLETDVPALEELLDEFPETRLIVIDPISAYGNGQTDTHKNAEVRAQLAELAKLAEQRKVAVVAVSHMSKGGASKSVYRVTGSLAYTAAPRVAWLLAKDRDDESRRVLAQIKNNIGMDPGALAFRVEDGRVTWEPDVLDISADDLMAMDTREGDRGGRSEAEEFLRSALADGPCPAAEVTRQAEEAGIGPKALRKARERICISFREAFGGGWLWRLKEPPDGSGSHHDVPKMPQDAHSPDGGNLGALDDELESDDLFPATLAFENNGNPP